MAVVVALLAIVLAPAAAVPLIGRLAAEPDPGDGTKVAPPSPAAMASLPAASAQNSSVTVQGKGDFANLQVTVSKTRSLINETVSVTWKGGAPTPLGTFANNYLQIFQCWGEDADGPNRTQCEFGGRVSNSNQNLGGFASNSRQVTGVSGIDKGDPLVAAKVDYVPFVAAPSDEFPDGKRVEGAASQSGNPFFDINTTNEVDYARTRPDGTGEAPFEVYTYRESSGLQCAALYTEGTKKGQPRQCWLVIVPRGEKDADGTSGSAVPGGKLNSSPLTTANWANRLVVPLNFAPVGNPCPIDAKAYNTIGVEAAAELIQRWQPALCENNGPVFDYSQTPNGTLDRLINGDSPELYFTDAPVDPPPSDRVHVYAPIAVSGLGIAVAVDRQYPSTSKLADRLRDGEQMPAMNLTPRIVAKMLTQSYVKTAPGFGRAGYLQSNPDNVTKDPDFLALNPDYAKDLAIGTSLDVLVPLSNTASNGLLWQWIADDPDAMDFLAGLPDPWGMRVNPFYQGMDVDRTDFPKIDPYCFQSDFSSPRPPKLCSLDEHPYANDYHEAARSALRGDSLARTRWDNQAIPPAFKKEPTPLLGQRALLGVADTATAARYLLVMAKLRNAAGKFVAPTADALTAAVSAMKPSSVPGVLTADPEAADPTAYPLPIITYAVTAPNKVPAATRAVYSNFLTYAAGQGQTPGLAPGTLPDGYVPLTAELKAQALAAAAAIKAGIGPSPSPSASTSAAASATTKPATTTRPASTSTTTTRAAGSTTPAETNPTAPQETSAASLPAPSPTQSGPTAPTAALSTQPSAGSTPSESGGPARYVLVAALTLGVAAALFGPSLPKWTRRLRL